MMDASSIAKHALRPEVAAVMTAAAKGDISAQRQMRNDSIDALVDSAAMPNVRTLLVFEALFFARLCACHGNADDARRLAGMLIHAAGIIRSSSLAAIGDSLMTESLCILEELSAAGDETAASAAITIAASEPIHVVQTANKLCREEVA
ncbi:hypothetical protein A0J57_05400 [Sphingobium sp. 22B]|uniref:hypothetical protein n=1 Tax=unclassified Sphingobium TaxID=2611147 RepID=UPI0007813CB5|nr:MULTISPECIES: hypothetical protein [unclassified Sphingobium]KXU31548.1 hypothetical protein AXW74_11850 [Sphingobium sp. AM]KYC33544.1 hypothetical protein A0J57_05400 [Sphingobium sp. 22B]OAP32725.1 hypothetical protein A8O16_07520 [Sphingobium sp. 20006FA]